MQYNMRKQQTTGAPLFCHIIKKAKAERLELLKEICDDVLLIGERN